MEKSFGRLSPREHQIVDLLLQGCDNREIARQLKMKNRTVKAHFSRLFLRFGIQRGIKRVKLATLLYRSQQCRPVNSTGNAFLIDENAESRNLLPKGSQIATLPKRLEPPSTSSRTGCA